MAATLEAGRRGRDLVVVDLPRQLDDAAQIALQAADQTYLVVPAELRAAAAAARVAATVTPHCPPPVAGRARPGARRAQGRRGGEGARPAAGRHAAPRTGPVPGAGTRRSARRRRPRTARRALPPADRRDPAARLRPVRRDRARRRRGSATSPSGSGERFAAEGAPVTAAAVVSAVRADPAAAVLGDTALLRTADRVRDDLLGVGPLAPLLADPSVSDVLVNGARVWVDRGAGLRQVALDLGGPDDVRRLAQRLAAASGRRLDDGCPYVDAQLPDGTRLHAVLPPVATAGPYLSLRTFRQRPFTLAELVGSGMVPPSVAPLLAAVVAARLAYLVTGGTGSGKTTLLNTLLGLVPRTERIILVEDAAELRPAHPHVLGSAGPDLQRGAGRHDRAQRPGPAGAADASRPARRRGVPRRRGGGSARRPEHRSRGRRGHPARQHPGRRAGPAGGARSPRRPAPPGAARPDHRRVAGRPPGPALSPPDDGWNRSACCCRRAPNGW